MITMDHTYILLGINPKGRGAWFCTENHVQNQDPQEKAVQNQAPQPELYSTESGPPWYSLEPILTTIRGICLPWLPWVGYKIKTPKV